MKGEYTMSMLRSVVGGGLFALTLAAAIPLAIAPVAAQWKGGNISLDTTEVARGNKAPVTVNLTVAGSAVSMRRIYVKLRCSEQVDVSHHISEEKDDKGKLIYPSKSINVTKSEVLYEKDFTLAAGQELAARSHHNFKGEIEIPPHLPPSFKGRYARVKWEAYAAADTTAWVDPATSWQEITVK